VKQLRCDSRTTLASAVFATPATVTWACGSGVAFVDSEESPFSAAKWHCSAGKYADHLTLKKAEAFWLQLDDESLLDGIAYRGCIHTLRLLSSRREALSLLSFEITAHAAVSGSVQIAWLNSSASQCSLLR
jgi:hypothetical protein